MVTKSELIKRLVDRNQHLAVEDAALTVTFLLDTIAKALSQGNRIEIRGFGSFSLNHRKPRLGRNPKTGEPVSVVAKSVPHFKPGLELQKRVDGGKLE